MSVRYRERPDSACQQRSMARNSENCNLYIKCRLYMPIGTTTHDFLRHRCDHISIQSCLHVKPLRVYQVHGSFARVIADLAPGMSMSAVFAST